jgi:hypothetical protein
MGYALAPHIEDVALFLAAHPAVLAWAAGWLAAGLGFWLRAVMPQAEEDLDLMIAIAGCGM